MQRHSIEYLVAAALAFLSTCLSLFFMSIQNTPAVIFAYLVFLFLINISSILFYKSLKVQKKWLKFPFSFVNLACYMILWAITWVKLFHVLQPVFSNI